MTRLSYNFIFVILAIVIYLLSNNNALGNEIINREDDSFPLFSSMMEVDAEVNVDAEMNEELEEQLDTEVNEELEVEDEADGEMDEEEEVEEEEEEPSFLEADKPIIKLVAGASVSNDNSYVVIPTNTIVQSMPDPYKLVKVVDKPAEKNSGWHLRMRGAPLPVNETTLFNKTYCELNNKFYHPLNISDKYPVREYVYVLIGGVDKTTDYLKPVIDGIRSFGVHQSLIVQHSVDYTSSTIEQANKLESFLTELSEKYDGQELVLITHGNAIIPVHVMLSLYPSTNNLLHGLIAYNPVWGGSAASSTLNNIQYSEANIKDLSYEVRQEFVKQYPIDYNALRLLVVSSHSNNVREQLKASYDEINKSQDEINDGVTTLADQIIPGARVITVPQADHFTLVYPQDNKPIMVDARLGLPEMPVNPMRVAQAVIAVFYKTTP